MVVSRKKIIMLINEALKIFFLCVEANNLLMKKLILQITKLPIKRFFIFLSRAES